MVCFCDGCACSVQEDSEDVEPSGEGEEGDDMGGDGEVRAHAFFALYAFCDGCACSVGTARR